MVSEPYRFIADRVPFDCRPWRGRLARDGSFRVLQTPDLAGWFAEAIYIPEAEAWFTVSSDPIIRRLGQDFELRDVSQVDFERIWAYGVQRALEIKIGDAIGGGDAE